jgi:probable phosphoglycerate mutase
MTQLVLVRHGESVWNAVKRLQGQQDLPLSVAGREQVKRLVPVVRHYNPERVICSDLTRASETASLLGYVPDRFDLRLREAFLGDWEGASIKDLRELPDDQYGRWRDGEFTPPRAETFAQLRERVADAVNELRDSSACVLVVTHGGVVRAALSVLLGIQPDALIPASPASATVIDLGAPSRLRAYNLVAYEAVMDVPD